MSCSNISVHQYKIGEFNISVSIRTFLFFFFFSSPTIIKSCSNCYQCFLCGLHSLVWHSCTTWITKRKDFFFSNILHFCFWDSRNICSDTFLWRFQFFFNIKYTYIQHKAFVSKVCFAKWNLFCHQNLDHARVISEANECTQLVFPFKYSLLHDKK